MNILQMARKMYCNENVSDPHLQHHLDHQGVNKCDKQKIITYKEKVPIPYLHDHLDHEGVNGEVCANRQVTIGKVRPQSTVNTSGGDGHFAPNIENTCNQLFYD